LSIFDPSIPLELSVSPKTATLIAGKKLSFKAAVTGGAGNTAAKWTASQGSITTGGTYTAPATLGSYTVTATSQEDPSKSDTATVAVVLFAIGNPPKGVFAESSTTFQAIAQGLDDKLVAWTATSGGIDERGVFTAPSKPQMVTITATSMQEPSVSASVQVKVSASAFDSNTRAAPDLLGFANAFGSTLKSSLDKYDFDNSGIVDDGDLTTLFEGMGW
jgi:hypothetical protein